MKIALAGASIENVKNKTNVMFQEMVCDKYTEQIKSITGQRSMMGVPVDILSGKSLRMLVSSNGAFGESIFKKSPLLLRSLAELKLHRIKENIDSVHFYFILKFPVISQANFYPLYHVYQSGYMINGTCFELAIPDKIILKDGKWYEFNCKSIVSGLCAVKEQSSLKETSCFATEKFSCSTRDATCYPYNYVNTEHGVILTSSLSVLAHPKFSPHTTHEFLITLNHTLLHTIYASWANYSYIKIVENIDQKNFKMHSIEAPGLQNNIFVETIDDIQSINFSAKPHLKGLSDIIVTNKKLHQDLMTELSMIKNISTNPEIYHQTIKANSFYATLALIISSVQGILTLYIIAKILQFAAKSCSTCFSSENRNK